MKKYKISELEREGLIKALGVKPKDVWEAKQNLIGFFSVLYEINERLKKEGKLK